MNSIHAICIDVVSIRKSMVFQFSKPAPEPKPVMDISFIVWQKVIPFDGVPD